MFTVFFFFYLRIVIPPRTWCGGLNAHYTSCAQGRKKIPNDNRSRILVDPIVFAYLWPTETPKIRFTGPPPPRKSVPNRVFVEISGSLARRNGFKMLIRVGRANDRAFTMESYRLSWKQKVLNRCELNYELQTDRIQNNRLLEPTCNEMLPWK